MSNLQSKFMNRIFRRVHGMAWDLTTGRVGVKTEAGIYTFAPENGGQVTVNPFDSFSMALPAFALQTKKADVQVGDLLVGDTKVLGWVTEVTEGGAYKLQDHNGHSKTYTPPKVAIMGAEEPTVMVVRNLMSLTGGADGAQGLANGLLPLLLLGKGDSDLEKLLPVLLMGNLGGQAGTQTQAANPLANPLLLMTLMKGKGNAGGDIDPMMLLMLSGGLTGGSTNPMMLMALMGDKDLFGGFGSFGDAAPELTPTRRGFGAPALTPLR